MLPWHDPALAMVIFKALPFLSLRRAAATAVLAFAPFLAHAASLLEESAQPWLPGIVLLKPSVSSQEANPPGPVVSPLTSWTERTLSLVIKYRQNPLRAARALAYVHVAMHDALLLASPERPAVRKAAAHRTASCVLAFLYPQEAFGKLEAEGIALIHKSEMSLSEGEQKQVEKVASTILEAVRIRAWNDGAERIWAVNSRPPFQEGQWREAPPLRIITPTEAMAGEWKTWVLKDGSEVQPPPPPPPDSEQELGEMAEVLQTFRQLTNGQKEIARRWNLDQGTVTPPGVWNKIVLSSAADWQLSDEDTVKVLAAMNVGMLDAFIACWRAKFTWWTQRPITAIHAKLAPDFMPLLLTPPFPAYVSGHATVSGAASAILAAYFPGDRARLQASAEEAALSRLYGGIHIRSDNEAGLELGRAVASKVVGSLYRGAVSPPPSTAAAGKR
ncbi:MAG TPA: vanadium-dependent haloperoxidase [Noviherbaspirillum sp.]